MEEHIVHRQLRGCRYCKPVVVEPRHIVDHHIVDHHIVDPHMLEVVDYTLLDCNLVVVVVVVVVVVDHSRKVDLGEDELPSQSWGMVAFPAFFYVSR